MRCAQHTPVILRFTYLHDTITRERVPLRQPPPSADEGDPEQMRWYFSEGTPQRLKKMGKNRCRLDMKAEYASAFSAHADGHSFLD